MSKVLRAYKIPEDIVVLVENLNKSQPNLQKEDKVDEFKARQFEFISECLTKELDPTGSPY